MTGDTDLVDLGPADQLTRGGRLVTSVDGFPLVVLHRRFGAPLGFVARCPHRGASLAAAPVSWSTVRCAKHGQTWNVRSGDPVPAGRGCRLVTVPVEVVDGRLIAYWSAQLRQLAAALPNREQP